MEFLKALISIGILGVGGVLVLRQFIAKHTINIKTILGTIGTFALATVLLSSFGTIGAGQRGVVLRFGAVTGRILEPGLYAVTPIIESVHPMDVQVQKESAKALASSKDLQSVATEVAVNYSLKPSAAAMVYKTIGDDYKSRIIDPAIQEAVKAMTAKFNAENLIAERNVVKEMLDQSLATRLDSLGIKVEAISITDFDFDPNFKAAIEAKVTATQLALKAQNDLQRVKFEADQRVATAQGEAEAIKIQAQAIESQGGAKYVELKAIEKWDGALPVWTTGGNATPFINMTPPSREK